MRVIGDWIAFSNQHCPHQAPKMMIPARAYAAKLSDDPSSNLLVVRRY